jgi:hypothetical protein
VRYLRHLNIQAAAWRLPTCQDLQGHCTRVAPQGSYHHGAWCTRVSTPCVGVGPLCCWSCSATLSAQHIRGNEMVSAAALPFGVSAAVVVRFHLHPSLLQLHPRCVQIKHCWDHECRVELLCCGGWHTLMGLWTPFATDNVIVEQWCRPPVAASGSGIDCAAFVIMGVISCTFETGLTGLLVKQAPSGLAQKASALSVAQLRYIYWGGGAEAIGSSHILRGVTHTVHWKLPTWRGL